MKDSTDAANWENPGNSGTSVKRVRKHVKHLDDIKQYNKGKVEDWTTSDDLSVFVTVNWGNVQIDPNQVKVGDVLLFAPKEEVLVGSIRSRLIARYNTTVVLSPDMCVCQGERHSMTVCTECIRESWLWDYLFRNVGTLRNFAHGTNKAYDAFGCRCDDCTLAHSRHLAPPVREHARLRHPDIGSQKI